MKKCQSCHRLLKDCRIKRKFCSSFCAYTTYKNKNYKTSKISQYTITRFDIFKRDDFRCIYCGKSSIEDNIKLEIDHLIPRNGVNYRLEYEDISKLITSCVQCNKEKSNNNLTQEQLDRISIKIQQSKIEKTILE